MKISYSILVHNETDTLEKLLKFLVKWKQPEDEIVILDDYSDDEKTKELLDFYVSTHNIVFEQRNLLGDFASQKNHLKSMGSGDYSFIEKEKGMFSFLGLSAQQAQRLRQDYGVYMLDSSRINVAGVNARNIDYLADAVAKVL